MRKNLIILCAKDESSWDYLVEKLRPDIGETINYINIFPSIYPAEEKNETAIYIDTPYERLKE